MRSLLSLRRGLECVDQSWCRGCRELPEPGSRQIAGMDPEPRSTATTLSCPLHRGVSGGIGYLCQPPHGDIVSGLCCEHRASMVEGSLLPGHASRPGDNERGLTKLAACSEITAPVLCTLQKKI